MMQRNMAAGPLSVEEIDVQYAGQWVLVKVTALDELRSPQEGEVIAFGTAAEVREVVSQIAASGVRPEMPYYWFLAGNLIRSAAAMQKAIEKARLDADPQAR